MYNYSNNLSPSLSSVLYAKVYIYIYNVFCARAKKKPRYLVTKINEIARKRTSKRSFSIKCEAIISQLESVGSTNYFSFSWKSNKKFKIKHSARVSSVWLFCIYVCVILRVCVYV